MRNLILGVVLLVGCTSPEEVIVLPNMGSSMMGDGLGGGGGNMMPTVEYRCPKCGQQYKTEYLAQQCIDKHD